MHQNPGVNLDGGINEGGKWQARWEKLVFFTQCYGVPSGRAGKTFVSNLAVELNDVRGWKCNAERVIVFQTVILQYV